MQVLAISGVRCYNIRVGFCPDGGRLHAYVKVRMFHKRGHVFLRSQQNQVLNARSLPILRMLSTAERLLSPGVGTEGAELVCSPLEWVAPDYANPFRCFIMTQAVMNTTRGAKPQGSPHRQSR